MVRKDFHIAFAVLKGTPIKMKYRDYSAREFANDSFFIRWVKNPDAASDWFWKSFVKENPACVPAIEEARRLISLVDFSVDDLPDEELNSMRTGLLMALHAEKEEERDAMSVQSPAKSGSRWLLAAAVIIIPLVAGILFFTNGNKEADFSMQAESAADVEKRINPSGQKSVLFLADGTKVWLNAASKLSYAKSFLKKDTRDVYLEGEAFFDVAHNAEKPFIVHTSSINIKVLGTSFNVKSYPDEKTIETTLVHGKVRIEQSDIRGARIGDVELKPNQRAVFNKESRIINIKEVKAEVSGSWKQERMVFDAESIDNVILQMERWYDVKIHVENRGKLDCKLTATIENESLEEVLRLMKVSHDIEYRVVGSEVWIEGRLCE